MRSHTSSSMHSLSLVSFPPPPPPPLHNGSKWAAELSTLSLSPHLPLSSLRAHMTARVNSARPADRPMQYSRDTVLLTPTDTKQRPRLPVPPPMQKVDFRASHVVNIHVMDILEHSITAKHAQTFLLHFADRFADHATPLTNLNHSPSSHLRGYLLTFELGHR